MQHIMQNSRDQGSSVVGAPWTTRARPWKAAALGLNRVLSDLRGTSALTLLDRPDATQMLSEATQSVQGVQLIARGDPACGHDVRSLSA